MQEMRPRCSLLSFILEGVITAQGVRISGGVMDGWTLLDFYTLEDGQNCYGYHGRCLYDSHDGEVLVTSIRSYLSSR